MKIILFYFLLIEPKVSLQLKIINPFFHETESVTKIKKKNWHPIFSDSTQSSENFDVWCRKLPRKSHGITHAPYSRP